MDLCTADVAYSNLGGLGPHTGEASGIRYVNVGASNMPDGSVLRFDLVLTNRSRYTPGDASANGIDTCFAQVNIGCNTAVDLRVQVYPSCNTLDNCRACESLGSPSDRDACYSAGCSCFGQTCNSVGCCSGAAKEEKRWGYSCPQRDTPIVLPSTAFVGLAVYDLDGGPSNEYVESFTSSGYAYYQTPLRGPCLGPCPFASSSRRPRP